MSRPTNRLTLTTLEGREVLTTHAFLSSAVMHRPAGPAAELRPVDPIPTGVRDTGPSAGPTVKPHSLVDFDQVFTVRNESGSVRVGFSIRWSPNGPWTSYVLAPGQSRRFWHPTDTDAQIRFDYSLAPGYQAKMYRLTTKPEIVGRNGPVGPGQVYVFRATYGESLVAPSPVNGVELYRLR